MVTLYFSGTGNSHYIAKLFSKKMGANSHSIEEQIDFNKIIGENDAIVFVYPIYGSCVPKIMRNFVTKAKAALEGKKIIIFCTQYIFSGDGTRIFTELLPKNCNVIYTEHFFMPNNICNFFPLPIADEKKIQKYLVKSEVKMTAVCNNIKKGVVKRRGFTILSQAVSWIQRPAFQRMEQKISESVKIESNCNCCGICVSVCPMNNLKIENNKVTHNNNCTLCYRCVNKCPKKAITVFVHNKVTKQYKGVAICHQKTTQP